MIKKYFLILNVVLIIVALVILTDISFSFARAGKVSLPKPPLPLSIEEKVKKEPQPYDYYSVIAKRNLFAGGRGGEVLEEDLLETLSDTVSNLKLKGTIVIEGLDSLCIIEDSNTKKEEVYKRGDLVGGNEVIKIERDHVILRTSAGVVSLTVYGEISLFSMAPNTSALVEKVANNRWSLSRSELTTVISNPNQLLAQVKVAPYLEAGQVRGFRLDDVQKESLAEKLGARSGDIVRKVEGQELDGIERTIQIYKEAKDKPVIRIEVERDGRPITLTYEIKD